MQESMPAGVAFEVSVIGIWAGVSLALSVYEVSAALAVVMIAKLLRWYVIDQHN